VPGQGYNLAAQSEFQRVIFDAPATGHLRELLEVPAATQRAVRVGPLNHNARKIEDLLLDPERTRVLVATLAEEMPVREALEIVTLCRDGLRMGVGPVLVNGLVARRFADGELERMAALDAAGDFDDVSRVALTVARQRVAEADAQQSALQPLSEARLAVVSIPRVVQPEFDAAALLDEVGRHLQQMPGPAA
jgi:anion-transporting  ArsA/GET3 family ATPase